MKTAMKWIGLWIVFAAFQSSAGIWKKSGMLPGLSSGTRPTSNTINAILTDGNAVWVGTGRELLLTTDRGVTWAGFSHEDGLGKGGVSALAGRNGSVWVATAFDTTTAAGSFPAGGGLAVTTDGGQSWQRFPQPVDSRDETRYTPTTTVIQNLTYDIAVTDSAVWITSWGGGVRRSSDGGMNWEVVTVDGLPFNAAAYLTHVAFSAAFDGEALWIGTAGGIHKTTDEGRTWTTFNHQNQVNPISGNFVVALAPQTGIGRIWASTIQAVDASETNGLSYSDDGGLSWTVTLNGEFVHNLAFHPISHTVYGVSDNGVHVSADAQVWTTLPQIVDSQTGEEVLTTEMFAVGRTEDDLWIGSADGLAFSGDEGISWTVVRAFKIPGEDGEPETYAYPNPFSPMQHNRIGGDGFVRFQYRTKSAASVTVRIYDFAMRLVRTVVRDKERPAAGDYAELWDGKNESGELVANGVYFYRVALSGGKTLWGKVMVVN